MPRLTASGYLEQGTRLVHQYDATGDVSVLRQAVECYELARGTSSSFAARGATGSTH